MSDQVININDINSDFNENTEPQDHQLTELIKQAYQKKIYCRVAVVSMDNIVPFSDYEPNISEDYVQYFQERYKSGKPPMLLVYRRDDGKFVMSDDYNSYFMYKRNNAKEAICELLDAKTVPNGVIEASEPYYMAPPTIEQIN